MWLVEIDSNNTVHLRGFDSLSGTLLCEYFISDPDDRENRQYTPEKQMGTSSAPVFPDSAETSLTRKGISYSVSVPAAVSTDGNIVFLYRIFVYAQNGNLVSSDIKLNNYWLGDTYDNITFKVMEKGYSVKVIAENAYSMRSAELCTVID